MAFDVPDGLRYAESHEWIERRDDRFRVGITDFAQDELGDIVFVDLPDEGKTFTAEDDFGVVESIKAVSDVYVPVTGTVVAVNDRLEAEPELVNEDPFGEGWFVELTADEDLDHLLGPGEYRAQI
jgi:glycine cleavage system H protein